MTISQESFTVEYRDGIKGIGDKIGMAFGADLRVSFCITLLLK